MRPSMPLPRSILALLAILFVSLLIVPNAQAAPPPTQGVKVTAIGHPTWVLVDFHVFSAPIGTAASGYQEFTLTTEALLPPPNHVHNNELGVGPGQPHSPPYDGELAAGLTTLGFREGARFSRDEFSNGMGVWATWMGVPTPGTTGSSPDFPSGPIIPNDLYPVHVAGSAFHNGSPFSALAEFDVPALDSLTPPFNVDGASHFPFFFADNADFGPAGANLRGSYRWQITITDASGNGWQVEVHFAIAP